MTLWLRIRNQAVYNNAIKRTSRLLQGYASTFFANPKSVIPKILPTKGSAIINHRAKVVIFYSSKDVAVHSHAISPTY